MPRINTSVDTTVDVEIDVEIYCATCGKGLCDVSLVRRSRNAIDVEACPECLNNARDNGYIKGFEDAKKEFEGSE